MAKQRITGPLLAGLALLASGGPFATDMYLPLLPHIATDLQTSPALVQLTLSAFMLGMAIGQLFIGPFSDGHGRHKLMVSGAVIGTIAGVACAIAPSIWLLIAARFVLGLGMGACVVLARATVADLAGGRKSAQAFSILMTIQALAPIIAPVIGGVLAEPIGWRGMFWVLAGVAVAQFFVAVFMVRESRPLEERTDTSLKTLFQNIGIVLRNRVFLGYALVFASMFGSMFAYIAASPFVYQNQLGVSTFAFGFFFALNASGMMAASLINARLVKQTDPHFLMVRGVAVKIACVIAILVMSLTGPSLWILVPLLMMAVAQMGFVMGNTTALGTSAVRKLAGTGSAVMGGLQFFAAGIVSPIVSLGSNLALTMAIVMLCCLAVAVFGIWLTGHGIKRTDVQ